MVPTSAQPPERHFGYICSKCQAASFAGRRYACWMCIGYQICGNCYDSDQLPEAPEHKYFHPLEVHYTRAEYELYFAGEPYSETTVPQSYKCALCNQLGFSTLQLYKHLSDAHRGHKDFDEYFSILYTRHTADAAAATVRLTENVESVPANNTTFVAVAGAASGSGSGSGSGSNSGSIAHAVITPTSAHPRQRAIIPVQRPMMPVAAQRNVNDSAVSFREAVRMTQARRAALLEQQALNVLEELSFSNNNNPRYYATNQCLTLSVRAGEEQGPHLQQLLHQQLSQLQQLPSASQAPASARSEGILLDARTMRNPKVTRLRNLPATMRLGTLFPKVSSQMARRTGENDWVTYWAHSSSLMDPQQQQQAERLVTSYADVLREAPEVADGRDKNKDKDKTKSKEKKEKAESCDSNKFLCAQFMGMDKQKEESPSQHDLPPDEHRMHFTGALLCSMLAEEQLAPVTMPLVAPILTKATPPPTAPAEAPKATLEEADSNVAATVGHMDRFYKNLDMYNKWLADFAIKKQENDSKVVALPDMILQATHDPVGIDSDMDPDTDDRDEEDDAASGADQEVAQPESEGNVVTVNLVNEPHDSQIEIIEVEDGDGEVEGDGEGEGEGEGDVEDEEEEDYEDNSGSETSESTIALLVNEIDQVYGY